MGYLKRFSDLAGGVAAFFAAVFLLGKYMEYDPAQVGEGKSKLEWFFSSDNSMEYRQYLVLIGLMVLCVALGLIFKKIPAVSLVASVLPLCQAMSMLYTDLFYEFAYFYVAVCFLMFCANLYETAVVDKANGQQTTVFAARAIGLLGGVLAFVSLYANKLAQSISDPMILEDLFEKYTKIAGELKAFGMMFYLAVPQNEPSTLIFLATALVACVLISMLLSRVHFINALLAFVPFVWSVSAFHARNIAVAPMLVIVPAAAYFACCLALVWRE